MKKIIKLLLPILAILIPQEKSYASLNINDNKVDKDNLITSDEKKDKKNNILYKFFNENKNIQFIKHSSHKSHSSHSSHRSGSYGSSSYSDTYSNTTDAYSSTVNTNNDYNKDYDNLENLNKVFAYAYMDLNVRSDHNSDSKILTTIKKGTKVKIDSREFSPWYKISVNEYTGYVNYKYLYY